MKFFNHQYEEHCNNLPTMTTVQWKGSMNVSDSLSQ